MEFKDVLNNMYRNELTSTDFQQKETRQLFDESRVYSNLLNYATIISNLSPVVYNTNGDKAFDFYPTTNSERSYILYTYVAEEVYRKINSMDMYAEDLKMKLAYMVDLTFANYFKNKATATSTKGTTLDERLIALKDSFGSSSFVIVAGFKTYLDIMKEYRKDFPYQVLYSPRVEDDGLYGFMANRLYVAATIGEIDQKKNVLTGQYIFALNVMNLQVGCDEVYKA